MAKGGSKSIEVARAVRSLQRWGGPPSGRIELLVKLRRLGKSSVDIARLLDASDSHIRNSLRAYDWMRANKTWRSFCLAEYRANLAAVLDRMAVEAAVKAAGKAVDSKSDKPASKAQYRESLAAALDGKTKVKPNPKAKAKSKPITNVIKPKKARGKAA